MMNEVDARTGSGMISTGSPIQLIDPPTTALPEGYSMVYAVTTNNTAPDATAYTASIPTKSDAGTYYVWYKVAGDGNHADTEAQCVISIIRAKITATVTFVVKNGSWDDGTAGNRSVVLEGVEGDTLKLSADQIPAVGTKPNANYKAGSWDVVPDTANAIIVDTAYTYTYVNEDSEEAITPEDENDDIDGIDGKGKGKGKGKDGKDGAEINRDLRLGSQGLDVRSLQIRLTDLGYYYGTIDGDFGTVTDAAVRAFQAANGLYVDGIVGAQTRAALGGGTPNASQGTASSQGTPSDITLSLGSTGDAVLALQRTLISLGYYAGTLDGYFGPYTEATVKAFQTANNLYVDGVVGPYTWAVLRDGNTAYTAPGDAVKTASETETAADTTGDQASHNGDLVYGMTNDEVAYVQLFLQLLGYDVGVIDGYFGDMTLAAVKAFQSDFGLYVDGVIGAQTKAAMGIQ